MIRKIRNRLQILKPTNLNLYKLLPLVFVILLVIITIGIGIADPTLPPPEPIGGGGY